MSKIQDVFQFMQVMDQIKLIPKDYDNLSDKDKINYIENKLKYVFYRMIYKKTNVYLNTINNISFLYLHYFFYESDTYFNRNYWLCKYFICSDEF